MREGEARQVKTCYVAGADKSIKEAWNRIRREFSQFRTCHPQFGNCKSLYRSSAQDTANEKRTFINRLVTAAVGLSMVKMKKGGARKRIYAWPLPFARKTSPAESFRLRKV